MNELTRKVLDSFYDEMEETLLAVLAAGVPMSEVSYENPRYIWNDNIFHIESKILFNIAP